MVFSYLLLGHLIGDFVLQTDKIAANKSKYWQWNMMHSIIVTFCMLAFSIPFGVFLCALVIISGVLHFILDSSKPLIAKKLNLDEMQCFILDQMIHVVIIGLISFAGKLDSQLLFMGPEAVDIFLVIVFVTSFAAVFNQMLLGKLFPRTDNSFFKEGEKQIGIMTRLFITAGLYLALSRSPYYLVLVIPAGVIYIFQFSAKWYSWMSPRHVSVKVLLDLGLCVAAIILIFLF